MTLKHLSVKAFSKDWHHQEKYRKAQQVCFGACDTDVTEQAGDNSSGCVSFPKDKKNIISKWKDTLQKIVSGLNC